MSSSAAGGNGRPFRGGPLIPILFFITPLFTAASPRLARSGLSNVHPVRIADERDNHVKRLAGKIDRALVDAPCSGFGTLRRNPDLKWRQSQAAIRELAAKQARLLAAAAGLLKPGGRLVYATCSVLPDENEAIVEGFLAGHPEFAPGNAAITSSYLTTPTVASAPVICDSLKKSCTIDGVNSA